MNHSASGTAQTRSAAAFNVESDHLTRPSSRPSPPRPPRLVRQWYIPHTEAAEAEPRADLRVGHTTNPARTESDTAAAARPGDDGVAPAVRALHRALSDVNRTRKTLLMAALGGYFATAGLSNDGVNSSFSAVHAQTLLHRLGLPRLPPTLLVSWRALALAQRRECGADAAPDPPSPSPASSSGAGGRVMRDWVDISAHPTATLAEYRAALHEALTGLGVPETVVEGNAEPVQLPQALLHVPTDGRKRRGRMSGAVGVSGLILRYAFDVPGQRKADTFQDLTNRFTLYLVKDRCITVHRTPCNFVESLKSRLHVFGTGARNDASDSRATRGGNRCRKAPSASARAHGITGMGEDGSMFADGHRLVQYFVQEVAATYNRALARCVAEFDNHEARLFSSRLRRSMLARDIYYIKRRASVYARALALMEEALTHMAITIQMPASDVGYQETQHEVAHVFALAESINANTDSVLQILFQLSSYQVNELMRLLTLFSAFFIPLSFIAAVYGMNFEHLPFLHAQYGELYCFALMCVVTLVIFVWFKMHRFI